MNRVKLLAWATLIACVVWYGRTQRHHVDRVNAKGEPIAALLIKRGAR